MSWPAGSCVRRCCWPIRATGRSGSSLGAGRPPDPLRGGGQGRHQRLSGAGAPQRRAAQGPGPPASAALPPAAVLTGPARPGRGAAGLGGADLAAWQQGAATRPVPGGAGAPGRGHATPAGHERPGVSCRHAGCWSNGRSARPPRPSTGSRTCPRPRRWWNWSVWRRSGQVALASGAGLPRAQGRPRAGPLRGAWLARLAPPRHAGHSRARLSHPGTTAPPKTGGVGLTLWQLLGELQVLLACWAGACPVCQRPAPGWLRRTGRPRAPT
jgi:hypothetical protein